MSFQNTEPWTTIVPIHNDGLTNDLFLVNQKWFVKKSRIISQRFLNLTGQLNVATQLQDAPFTIPIIDIKFKQQNLWTVMPFYDNVVPLSKLKRAELPLATFADLVKQLHDQPITKKLPYWNPISQLETFTRLITDFNSSMLDIKNYLLKWLTDYQPSKLVLCHNDLSPNNLVFDQKRWFLIDWDFAAINDAWFDVASFASETLSSAKERNDWYQLFNVTPAEMAIIRNWILYQNLIWYSWATFLYQNTNDIRYQKIVHQKWMGLKKH